MNIQITKNNLFIFKLQLSKQRFYSKFISIKIIQKLYFMCIFLNEIFNN